MTKAELVSVMAQEAGITKAAAASALEAYVATIAKELKKNGKIGLVGFGTFSVVKRKAREGRNPQTGKTIKIPAKKVVKEEEPVQAAPSEDEVAPDDIPF